MEKFDRVFARAAKRHGDAKSVEAELPKPKSPAALGKIPDDRWLTGMTKAVFQAGFVWRVIENKWPGFEEAFNIWRQESGLPLMAISRTLALSADPV